jgi:glycosyltransferase involved in cell wall biosynthesis
MYKESDISIVVPSYNNLEYLKLLYKSVRDISKDVELIMFSDGSTDGTDVWMNSLEDDNIIVSIIPERTGNTYLYDWGFEKSTRAVIGILHADMFVHKNFFKNIIKHLGNNNVVCGTCVEPPLHPPGNEKHIFNAGMYPDEFNETLFNNFCDKLNTDVTTEGIFAPWFVLREEYFEKVGGHDKRFIPTMFEDSDLFARMDLAGMKFVQSRDAFVYHFTQRGGRWVNGEVGNENNTFKISEKVLGREYVRKFGTYPRFNQYRKPIPAPKYNVGYVIQNCSPQVLEAIEPFASNVYVDFESSGATLYIQNEKTILDLNTRILPLTSQPNNAILVEFNGPELRSEHLPIINQLPDMISEADETGTYEIDIFRVTINNLQSEVIDVRVPI